MLVEIPPSVMLIAPTNNANIVAGGNLTLSAVASDVDGTVVQVQFFQGTNLLGTDTNAPYSLVWSNTTSGIYGLTAQATDNNGLVSTSTVVNVTLAGIFINSPANYFVFTSPSNISVSATTIDNLGINQVEFFQGATSLGVVTNAPYSLVWSNVPSPLLPSARMPKPAKKKRKPARFQTSSRSPPITVKYGKIISISRNWLVSLNLQRI